MLHSSNVIGFSEEKEYLWICQKSNSGHATAHVSRQSSPCEICGKDCGTGTGFSPIIVVYSCQYYSISAPYSYFIHLPQMLCDIHA